jgi:hypothetical protein
MTDKHLTIPPDPVLDERAEPSSLDSREVEVRLAIADYVIRRVAGTAAGQEIFDALIPRFENRYPQHKLLAHLLTSPGHLETDAEDLED